MENATSGICCQMNTALVTQVGQIEHAQHIDPDDFQLQQHKKVGKWKPSFTVQATPSFSSSPCDPHTSQHWGVQSGQQH